MTVPKLRFKEFKDEWKHEILNEKVDIFDGTHQTPNYTKTGVKFLSVENIRNLSNSNKYISVRDFQKNFKICPKRNDILMTRIGDIGTPNIIDSDENYAFYVSLALLKSKGNINMTYLLYLIQSKNFQKELWRRTLHIAFPKKINKVEIAEINIIYTKNDKEQNKIANFLTLLDKKIELQRKKIEALKIYKKGLSIKLFNSLNCNEKQIKDIGIVVTGTTPYKDNSNYWYNGNIPWVTPSDITEAKNIYSSEVYLTQSGLSVGRALPKNSLLVTCIASIGKNAILRVDGSCNQQINAIIPNADCDIDFLYYLFEQKKAYMQSIAGTSATSIINKSSFEKILIRIPTIDVQKQISKILSLIDNKIDLQNYLLKNLILLKKYLLQQMFI